MKKSRRYLLDCGWRSSHLYTRQPSKANLILKPGVLEDLRQFISMGAHLNLTSYEIEIRKLYPGTYFSVSHTRIHFEYEREHTVEHRQRREMTPRKGTEKRRILYECNSKGAEEISTCWSLFHPSVNALTFSACRYVRISTSPTFPCTAL